MSIFLLIGTFEIYVNLASIKVATLQHLYAISPISDGISALIDKVEIAGTNLNNFNRYCTITVII